MADFDGKEFISIISVEEFHRANISKDDLKFIATSFEIISTNDVREDQWRGMILTHQGVIRDTEDSKMEWVTYGSVKEPQYIL